MRVPIIPCPLTDKEKNFKKVGEKFLSHPVIKKYVNNPDEWINMKFEQIFNLPMTDFRAVDLDPGRVKTLEGELKRLTKHVDNNKGLSKIAKILYTTSAKVKASPEYAKLYDDFIDIQHSYKGRDMTNGLQYQKLLDNLQLEAIARGLYEGRVRSPKKLFNKSAKEATKLWNKQMEHSVDAWNKVSGSDVKLREITKEVEDYKSTREGKIFFDFINIIEKELPKASKKIDELLEERARLKKKGEDYSHIRKKYDPVEVLGEAVPSQHMRNAIKDYLELMDDNFRYLSSGITAYAKGVKAGLESKGWDASLIDKIVSDLKKKIMPDKELGYYPHYSTDINAEFLNGLMLKLQRISELTAEQPQDYVNLKKGQSLKEAFTEAIKDTEGYIASRAKHRSKSNPNDYSYLFPVTIQRYTSEVSRFNYMAHTQQRTRETLNMLKNRFKEGKDMDGYGTDIVNLIQGMHFDMTGQRSVDSPEFNAFLRTVLNLEYVSKIGGNIRTAGKNMSQWLVNWVEFGARNQSAARRFYAQDPEMSIKVDQLLKESGLFYEEAPRELEEGAAFSRTKVKLAGDLTLEFSKPSFWEKSAEKTSKLAGSFVMSGMMRKVENINRKSAFKTSFYQTYTELKNNVEFNNSRIAAGKSASQIEAEIIGRARRTAIRITSSLHYDYSHISKSAAMKHPVGAVVFQFQHFLNEFTRFNSEKIRGMKNDWATKRFGGPQAWQAYRLGMAYAIIPGILSLIFKSDFFNIIEHATLDKVNQLFVALTGDDDEIKKAFYGKGVNIGGFVGAPLIGDIVTIGELANLYKIDEDGWADMIFGFSDYGTATGDQKAYAKMRIANGQLARFLYRTSSMMTSGHFMMGLQSELGLYPSGKIKETREDIMAGLGNLSPELRKALEDLYEQSQRHRKGAIQPLR
jgi:hypothetical protein